jgi:hypothetical protein
MADPILHKRADTPGKVPAAGDLTPGELAINTGDGKLFTKRADGVVVEIIGSEVLGLVALEDISVGDFVNVFSDNGAAYVRLADGGPAKRPAHGFVKAAAITGSVASVTPLGGTNAALAGLTPGAEYFLSTAVPGGVQITIPNGSNTLRQPVGVAVSATQLATINGLTVELV